MRPAIRCNIFSRRSSEQTISEYGGNGLLDKRIVVNADGSRAEKTCTDSNQAARVMAAYHPYSSGGSTANGNPLKYDSRGNAIEFEMPAKSERWTTTFDSQDREVETKVFRNGGLDHSSRSAYESDSYGNWIKREESTWLADFPQFGYRLTAIYPSGSRTLINNDLWWARTVAIPLSLP